MTEINRETASEGAPPAVADSGQSGASDRTAQPARGARWRAQTRNLALGAALAGGVALAFAFDPIGAATAPTQDVPGTAAAVAAAQAPAAAQDGDLRGQVREVIDVTDYTYLRVEQAGRGDVWAAVPSARVKVGDTVAVYGPQQMTNFTSSTLKRTFEVIYFGNLKPAGAAAANVHGTPGGDPHVGVHGGPTNPHAGIPGAPGGAGDPHGKPLAGGDGVPVGEVAKAEGPNARTVAQVYADKRELGGKPIRLRGVVVKSVPQVLGKTFLHVRDGSGEAAKGNHDLTVTTDATPAVGATVLLEGTLTLDKDFGSGYRYEVIVENARVVDG